jgi:two-component system OmpR family response regulator
MKTVLVVEDEQILAKLVQKCVQNEGYQCYVTHDGEQGWQEFGRVKPDLTILDLNLPQMNGLEVCTRIRRSHQTVGKYPYVLMLTGRDSIDDRVVGYSTGADHYLPKPFDLKELAAMVRSLLNREFQATPALPPPRTTLIETTLFTIDKEKREIRTKTDQPKRIKLPIKEFDLLVTLAASRKGRVWERGELLDAVWGEEFLGSDQIITVYVGKIRDKLNQELGTAFECIKTHPGVGYSFEDLESA